MLRLQSIKKDYKAGDTVVQALKGLDISFRKNEFVSILGPSGCGKTTLLNIIGGLDHYSDGELFIDNVSTKNYTDRDWDTYRNRRIGFVFQSYNLIPHQTISENVELALTISGIEKAERVKRAHEALDKVGLQGQYNKKPNQLSGGQCQRVAIARALVNNPEILLADEPTGALDTTTSVQIMDLIQEIAKECLVIMVTHNPELAEKYSTRIIRLLDGELVGDTNPFDGIAEATDEIAVVDNEPENTDEPTAKTSKKKKRDKKAKLSLWGAFKLSAKNLMSKFKRTFLVCLAGSIGIIGVATVLAVSSGVQNYIHDMQNDMLSGNPVMISEDAMNMSALMSARGNSQTQKDAIKNSIENGYINVDKMIEYLVERSGDISSFKVENDITQEYVDYVKAIPKEYYKAITLNYGIDINNNLFTEYNLEGGKKLMSVSAAEQMFSDMLGRTDFGAYSSLVSSFSDDFMQAPDNAEFVLSQYDIIGGNKLATEANEIMIVVNDTSEMSDLTLAQFGYYTQSEFFNAVYKATKDPKYNSALDRERFSYDELLGKTFTWYPNNSVYNINPLTKEITYNAYADGFTGGKDLTITAILRPKDGLSYGCLNSGFYYTSAFAQEILADSLNSTIVQFMNMAEKESIPSGKVDGDDIGIVYDFSYLYEGEPFSGKGYVGTLSPVNALMGQMTGQDMTIYTLTLRDLGGCELPGKISIYPTDFSYKDDITDYLTVWNSDKDIVVNGVTLTASERSEIIYTDNLALVINIVNNLIDIVTTALVAFTALSLVVSTVMIAIITYVSVIERVKEIGVIRSLGGRKRDVSALFNAETFIIGGISGVIGIVITYIISAIVNLIVGNLYGIFTLAALPFTTALIMVAISIGLTMIAGLIPASLAAKKDPVDALRSE